MDVDRLKSHLKHLWKESIVNVLGKVGIVASVNVRMTYVGIYYPFNANGYSLVMDAIEKVEGPGILPDDVVWVIDDMAEVHRLQKAAQRWEDDMALSVGQLGRVHLISQSGSLVLRVNGRQWLMDSSCVVPAPGEHPEDELTEVEPSPSVDRLWITMLEEPIPEAFENVVVKGHATMLADMLQKWPNQVNTNYNGRTLLHIAAAEGWTNCVRVLLEHGADIRKRNEKGNTPLRIAASVNRHQVVELLLLQEGCDVNEGNSRGYTPVHEAALAGYSRVLKLLIDHPKCQVNAQNFRGDTPLFCACRKRWASHNQTTSACRSRSVSSKSKGSYRLH
ncbi:E3 ubiquitin-protein ligase MIB2 [Geodia barretti]|uniref:RING-type E3 ubiquitin transferase n=1 Tax=Geodia barretti TaxID=519541 RepID=A0AA35TQX6_GEOBA|nr:E3 ubiquitin-protein ligase MIB2 [Geodia barretti]